MGYEYSKGWKKRRKAKERREEEQWQRLNGPVFITHRDDRKPLDGDEE